MGDRENMTDRKLLEEIDRKLEVHLVRCEGCRAEVCELSRIVRGNGRPGLVSQVRMLMAGAGLLGIVVAGIAVEVFRAWFGG
jgi:hypothetical protein